MSCSAARGFFGKIDRTKPHLAALDDRQQDGPSLDGIHVSEIRLTSSSSQNIGTLSGTAPKEAAPFICPLVPLGLCG
jgi:hypothetical protein